MHSDFITVGLCYETAGIPSNREIKQIIEILMNNKIDFDKAYLVVNDLIKKQGYSLSTVLKELVTQILNDTKILEKIPQTLSDLSDLENMVTKSTFGDIYITSLVGIFKKNVK
jgi:predicted CopG family antitoxin